MVELPRKGWVMVIDLNKCIGCQACTVACKVFWNFKRPGTYHIWWRIVETRPGKGYPKEWLEKKLKGEPITEKDYEVKVHFSYEKLFNNPTNQIPARIIPETIPEYGPNWDWDIGTGTKPEDAWYFYLPIQCMHCDNPACLKACPMPGTAIVKREDGIVLVNPTLCGSCMECVKACPYARMFWNPEEKHPSTCIFCAPLVERKEPPICVRSCPQKAVYFGRIEDKESPVYTILVEYRVALPLLPELAKKYGVKPRVFYIPPVLDPPRPDGRPRYDEKYLDLLFGREWRRVKKVLEAERIKGLNSKLIRVLTGYPTWKI
ncbi:MAG TPA: 4Fe-4S dicluster domain-containing protein [Pyrodictium sp.]|nr:4Fe-4S dicluster domain-containing protein [Pyrodictium sp.]